MHHVGNGVFLGVEESDHGGRRNWVVEGAGGWWEEERGEEGIVLVFCSALNALGGGSRSPELRAAVGLVIETSFVEVLRYQVVARSWLAWDLIASSMSGIETHLGANHLVQLQPLIDNASHE